MAQFSCSPIVLLVIFIAGASAEIIPMTVLKYPDCGLPKGLVQYYQRLPRNIMPLSPCALRSNNFNHAIPPQHEEGPWRLNLPLNLPITPYSPCSSNPTPRPLVIPTPPVTPCSQHLPTPPVPVPASVPAPACADSYLFSCQPSVVPVPCQQY